MVDAASSRPPGLRPPSGGEVSNLKILVDLGPDAPVDVLSGRIDDLSIVVEVGHRWGVDLARSAASLDLSYEIERGGPAALDDLLRREGWLRHGRRSWRRHRLEFFEFGWAGEDPEWVTLRDSRAERLLGLPTTVRHLEYSNPLELVLGGSGILFLGVVMAARLVRDWSTSRRTNVAVAREAEAEARMTEDRARLYRWLVDEARRGDSPIPTTACPPPAGTGQGGAAEGVGVPPMGWSGSGPFPKDNPPHTQNETQRIDE